ncbi:MAG: hypothetical protein V4527_00080 [Pseudomonadota bacterium]
MRAIAARWGLPWRGLIILSLMCVILFSAQAIVAVKLSATGAFNYYNILFDADSSEGIAIRAHGWSEDKRSQVQLPNYLHPFINYFTMPAFRVIAKLASVANGQWKEMQIREEMALFVSPACIALAAFAIGLALMWLNFSPGTAIAAAILYAVSYSSLIFGAVPDHFSMGGLSVVLLLAWLAFWIRGTQPIPRSGYIAWALIAVFATGVTISTIVVAFIVLVSATARRRGNFGGYVRAAGASGAILVGVVLCAALLSHLVALSASTVGLGPKDAKAANPGIISEVRVAGNYADFDFRSVVSKASEVGLHSVQAVVGLGVHRRPPFSLGQPDVIVPLAADGWSVSDIAMGAAFGVMVLLGLYVGLRRQTPEPKRIFAWACAAVLCASVILQSIYGRVAFLYSQHWLFPIVFFVVLAFANMTGKWRPAMRAAGATVLLVAIAASNFHLTGQTISLAQTIVADFLRSAT